MKYDKSRNVGEESSRTYVEKIDSGFFDEYMSGVGLDVGFAGYLDNIVPILDSAIGVDLNYPNYDGITLPFEDSSQDYIYSSHCLEHCSDPVVVIRDWYRVLKVGGFMILTVPNQYTYEKRKSLPSRYNGDHKRFYSPSTLLQEVEQALEPNSYRIRSFKENTNPDVVNFPPDQHSPGCYEWELVLEKVEKPEWELE